MISEAMDSSFPTRQFPTYDLPEPNRFDRNDNSCGIRLYIPDGKSLTLKLIKMIMEGLFVKIMF